MRGARTTLVIALVACIAGPVAHAQTAVNPAGCPGLNGAKLPTRATSDNGSVMTIVERSGGKMRYEMTLANGQKTSAVTYSGLFMLKADTPQLSIESTWNQNLAQFLPLKIGERIVADGTTRSATSQALSDVVTEMIVTGVETIRVGDCDYPVFKIDARAGPKAGPQVVFTNYYHEPSWLVLRKVTTTLATPTAPPRQIEQRIVKLE